MSEAAKAVSTTSEPNGPAPIRKTPGVCGGDACVRDTRIMVWLLVSLRDQGMSEAELLRNYPSLTGADLAAAWEYGRQHPEEIQQAIAANQRDDD
jgi:uncharacterized protein (DUF433 family)